MGLLQDLTKLNQKITYCESRLEQIRAKEYQVIPLTEEDIKTRAIMKEMLKSYHLEWEALSSCIE